MIRRTTDVSCSLADSLPGGQEDSFSGSGKQVKDQTFDHRDNAALKVCEIYGLDPIGKQLICILDVCRESSTCPRRARPQSRIEMGTCTWLSI